MSGLKPDLPDDLETLQQHAQFWADAQRLCNWAIGDIARRARAISEDALHQVFPPEVSPGLIARCEAVSLAYPRPEDRTVSATWTQYMKLANDPDRQRKLQEIVDQGLTTDESRKAAKESREAGTAPPAARWLLAVDVNYHLHRHWFSGAGVEAASRVTEWIRRTVERLKEKGLTDCVCCLDSRTNFRKKLTEDWEAKYKDRPPKDPELSNQLNLVVELLAAAGFCCVTAEGFEADDIMASYAKQFEGRVTLLSQDKDLKQLLSDKVNILQDVEWEEDVSTGDMMPKYKWLSAKQLLETTGLRPDQWAGFQAIMGDNVDGIKGAPGIGEKGATDLIIQFGSLDAVIAAAKSGDESIKEKKRLALIQLAEQLDVVRQLVTLRTDVSVPMGTRI